MNLIFHLSAAIVTVLAVVSMVSWKRQRRTLRMIVDATLFKGQKANRIIVDWPATFMSNFCEALDIPFEYAGDLKYGDPCKISLLGLVEAIKGCGLKSVEYIQKDKAVGFFIFQMDQPSRNKDEISESLSRALNNKCNVA